MAQTGSFIPKQSKSPASPRRKSRRIYVFTYISYVLFFGTLLVVGGMFAYDFQLQKSLENQKALLATERNSFSQGDIERVRELEQRLLLAEQLLNKHTAPSQILSSLEAATIQPVQLVEFTLERAVSDEYNLSVAGGVDSFGSLLFQRDTFEDAPLLTGAVIDGVGYSGTEEEPAEENATSLPIMYTLQQTFSAQDIAYDPSLVPEDTTFEAGADTSLQSAPDASATSAPQNDDALGAEELEKLGELFGNDSSQ